MNRWKLFLLAMILSSNSCAALLEQTEDEPEFTSTTVEKQYQIVGTSQQLWLEETTITTLHDNGQQTVDRGKQVLLCTAQSGRCAPVAELQCGIGGEICEVYQMTLPPSAGAARPQRTPPGPVSTGPRYRQQADDQPDERGPTDIEVVSSASTIAASPTLATKPTSATGRCLAFSRTLTQDQASAAHKAYFRRCIALLNEQPEGAFAVISHEHAATRGRV